VAKATDMCGIKTDAMLLRVREKLLRSSHLSSDIILAYCIHTILIPYETARLGTRPFLASHSLKKLRMPMSVPFRFRFFPFLA
jgi:hypothetical protein